jgi:riboflavin synthase
MFTGIIETVGQIISIEKEGSNLHFTIRSDISNALRIDQSLSHDGVCLTVVGLENGTHTVTAVEETLKRTNLQNWAIGKPVNLERAMPAHGRLDGHIVQGHVDATGVVVAIEDRNGSWHFTVEYPPGEGRILVDKGSICINGVSLTVVQPDKNHFSVAIIPFTFENTSFKNLQVGDLVNLEFDIIGKYLAKLAEPYWRS